MTERLGSERLWMTAHLDEIRLKKPKKWVAKLLHDIFHSYNEPQWFWGIPLQVEFWWWEPIDVRTRGHCVTGSLRRNRFPQYTRLPAEIRQQILRYVIDSPSDAPPIRLCSWVAAEALIQAADYQLILDLLAALHWLRRNHRLRLPLCGCNPWSSNMIAGAPHDQPAADYYNAAYLRYRYRMFHTTSNLHLGHRFAVSHYWALGQLILKADEVKKRMIKRVVERVGDDDLPQAEVTIAQADGSINRSSFSAFKRWFSERKTVEESTESKSPSGVTQK